MSATRDGGRPPGEAVAGERGAAGAALARPGGSASLSSGQRARVVAVTGASSFLGRNLIGLLEEDERVRRIVSVDVTPPNTAGQKMRRYEVDLTQATAEHRVSEIFASEGVDTVVHLAFLSSPVHATAWAHELESIGTMHILNAARRTGVRKIVMRSHTLLYGAHPTNPNYLTESHPLRARRSEPFFADKIEAEREVLRYADAEKGRTVTILRTAPILGPTVRSYLGRYLSRRVVPTILGFDPLWQLLHEADAVAAFKLAVDRDAPGILNIVGEGVLPLSTVVKLAGRVALPVPSSVGRTVIGALWLAQVAEAPPTLLDYLQYLCVADGERARRELGFSAAYTTREALLDFASAQHLRDARLLSETAA
jgi:UDP-glucose 4-epimerase